jgi:hypothetical protein
MKNPKSSNHIIERIFVLCKRKKFEQSRSLSSIEKHMMQNNIDSRFFKEWETSTCCAKKTFSFFQTESAKNLKYSNSIHFNIP